MPTRDQLLARITALRATLDDAADTLDLDRPMTESAIEHRLSALEATLEKIADGVNAIRVDMAGERVHNEQAVRQSEAAVREAEASIQLAREALSASKQAREMWEAADKERRDLADRVRCLEDDRIDRRAERRTYLALTGGSGVLGVVALGWSAWETIRLTLAGG